MKLIFTLITAITILCTIAPASERSAVEKLEKTPLFAFGGIGDAGTTSEGEIAFHTLFSSKSAESHFGRVLKSGNPQAKCYALLGLRLKNRVVFNEQVKSFIASKQGVQTCSGCSMMKQRMASVVASIQRGNYDKQAISKPSRQ
jgi:hypothetical protein